MLIRKMPEVQVVPHPSHTWSERILAVPAGLSAPDLATLTSRISDG
jgi:hypothetical protein